MLHVACTLRLASAIRLEQMGGGSTMAAGRRFDAVVFDLLTALIDSWTLWNCAAGSAEDGLRWRRQYLELTYAAGRYRPYEAIVHEAAIASGVDATAADRLMALWPELPLWPETPRILD